MKFVIIILIQTQRELDPGLEEAISSIIWATPRLQADVVELKVVAEQFKQKYGKEYVEVGGLICYQGWPNDLNH